MMNNDIDAVAPYSDRLYSDTVKSGDDETDYFEDEEANTRRESQTNKPLRYFDIDVDERDENVHDQLPSVEEAKANVVFERSPKKNHQKKLGFVLLGIAMIGFLAATMNVIRKRQKYLASVELVTTTLPLSHQDAFVDKHSPQSSALRWMVEEDSLQLPLPFTKSDPFVQRYVMSCLVFALTMSSSVTQGTHKAFHLLSGAHECEWNSEWKRIDGVDEAMERLGILCDDEKNVIEILFPKQNLGGELPLELVSLDRLEKIDLSHGMIRGTIPHMPYLRNLNLGHNNLTGILSEHLAEMTHLTSLRLSDNNLEGSLPFEFGSLTNLLVLDLNRNQLTGGLEKLDTLVNLEELYLSCNSFEELLSPNSFQHLSNLRVIDASKNSLVGSLPNALRRFSNLNHMDLSYNSLDGHIGEFEENHPLQYLDLSHNLFGGGLPISISQLSALTHLDISYNRFSSGIPRDSLAALTNLKTLIVTEDDDMGPGPLPEWLREMTHLEQLSFRLATRTGTIPTWFGELTQLELLDLDWNHLRGTIPTELGLLTNLKYLMLNMNWLTGTVPTEVSFLPNLRVLMLDTTNLAEQQILVGDEGVCEKGASRFEHLIADCSMDCPCCTSCCDKSALRCNMKDWTMVYQKRVGYDTESNATFVPVI